MKLVPVRGKVLVMPTPKEQSEGGITLPRPKQGDTCPGKVLAVGAPEMQNGVEIPFTVAVGDDVYFEVPYRNGELIHDNKRVLVVDESELIAVVKS